MRRALEIAALGNSQVSPNPMVGCVIVHKGKIIGEGWHERFGEAHAEVNAIDRVADKSLLPESTAYVTLEPCAHHGKTPPCADLLIRSQLGKVVIAVRDANPLVSGKGIKKLQAAGIEVETGMLEEDSRKLNRRFFTALARKSPYIILKWAETADGYIARRNYDSKWISSAFSRKLVHKWRTQEDAILVGSGTALHDNPQLTARDWPGRSPKRIVIDRHLKLSPDLHLFDEDVPTIVYNLIKNLEGKNLSYVKVDEEEFFTQMLSDLHKSGVQSVIVEGGAQILEAFLQRNLWDEIRLFKTDVCFGEGIEAPKFNGVLETGETLQGGDRLLIFTPKNYLLGAWLRA